MRTLGDESLTTQDSLGPAPRGGSPKNGGGHSESPAERNQEIELKLSGPAETLEELWTAAIAPGAKTPGRRLVSIYYDTLDFRLRRRGMTLRVRQKGNAFTQTIKADQGPLQGVMRRGEWSMPVDGPTPDLMRLEDPALRERIGLIVAGELQPVFTSDVTRHTRTYSVGGENAEKTEIEAALDLGEIRCEKGTEPIAEIELELVKGSPLAMQKEAARLNRQAPCQFQPLSKSYRGFALALGEGPSTEKAKLPTLTPESTVEESLELVLANCMDHWLANHAAVLDGSDTEGVHQMRVALRRMRSALTIFRDVLPLDDFEWLKREASTLNNGLGDARDWDVFDDELLQPVIRARPEDTNLQVLQEAVTEERRLAYERARSTLRSQAYLGFILELSVWLESRGWRRDNKAADLNRGVVKLADGMLRKRHKQSLKLGRNFATLPDEALHRLRISLKKLRYATEFFACLYRENHTRPYLTSLRQLQDDLGFLNDVAVAETRLTDLCGRYAGNNAGALQMAFGTVIGWHTHALELVRPRIAKDWRAFAGTNTFWHQNGGGI